MTERPTLGGWRDSQGEDVELCQQLLQAKGFDPGPVDGRWGDQTEAAVRAFQESQGMQADGVVGEDTWAALERDGGQHAGGGPDHGHTVAPDSGVPFAFDEAHYPAMFFATRCGDAATWLAALGVHPQRREYRGDSAEDLASWREDHHWQE